MKTFSIYRGQARTGIGEGPGHPVPHGEQYLAADPPLAADGELLSAARPWMTLDWRPADEQTLGDRIEAWSYFRHGGLRLVVRLSAAGTYDRRTAYFAHGRAFPLTEIAGACDPGAWLGRSEVFEEPWRDGQRPARPAPPAEPEMVRPAQVLEEPAVAGALLAHLYQGLVAGYPVVMAVPVADFAAGSPIHALVSFARAALPLALKTDCRIRVFTRLPDLFLRTLQADLIVVPENEAGNALAARRDATLLDRKGARREGRDLAREASEYAEAVLRRVLKLPGGLLAFSGAISRYLPKDRLPGEQEISRIPAIYNMLAARTDPARLGEWLRTSLLKQVNERPTGLAWDLLIRPEDWHGLAFGDLAEILVADAASDEARTLLRLAEGEARRPERRELVSEDWLRQRWSGLAALERPALLARLLGSPETGRSLVAAEVAARLSSSVPLSDLLAASPAASLLEAEHRAGLLGRRAGETADLAAAAGRDLGSASLLAQATAEGVLPTDWALRLLEGSDEAVLRAAAGILPVAVTSLHWHPVLDRLFERLLEAPRLPPTLWSPVAKALDQTDPMDPASGLKGFLVLTELLVRSRSPEGGPAVDRAWRVAEALSDRDERRDFLDRVIDSRWQSLRPDCLVLPEGGLRLPWLKDFAGLLLESESVRDCLETGALLALADRRAADLGRWLDPRMAVEPDLTTTALLRAHWWASWRNGSVLDRNGLRKAALAWLGSEVWRSRHAPPQARLEDWKQVVADLGDVTADELRGLFFDKPLRPCWPWITPFQDEQIQDLCGLARNDLGVLAELAENLDRERDLGYPIQGTLFEHLLAVAKPPQASELPPNALAFLSSSPRNRPVEPTLDQALLLFDQTRHRKDRAAPVLYQAIERALARDPLNALQVAQRLAPWSAHPQLVDVIERWRGRQPAGTLDGEVHEILQRNLLATAKAERPAAWNPAALDPAVRALLRKAAADDCWKRLGKAVSEYVKAGGRKPHPVSELVEQLQKTYPRLPAQERQNLESNGWETLVAVLKSQPVILREPLQKEVPLPVLELASLLLPHLGAGGVALRLLFLDAARDYARQEKWWTSLVAGVASSCRRGGPCRSPDREELALRLILQSILDLPASEARTAGPILEARMEQVLDGRWPRPRGIYAAPREIRQGAAQ
ncbi:MAG TPA: hypothetical protein VKK31_29205 [Thermoanaerobaculia bacterium]|nr:hypothetical protein [Thermoanaerobaculia bacterium]